MKHAKTAFNASKGWTAAFSHSPIDGPCYGIHSGMLWQSITPKFPGIWQILENRFHIAMQGTDYVIAEKSFSTVAESAPKVLGFKLM